VVPDEDDCLEQRGVASDEVQLDDDLVVPDEDDCLEQRGVASDEDHTHHHHLYMV
jgi:hypothetical protein